MKYKKYIYIHTFAKNLLSSALASFSLRRRLPFWQISGDFRVKNGGILGAFRGMKMGGFGAVLRWSCSWFYGAGMEVFGQSIGGDFGRKKESFKGLIWCALGLDFWRCLGGILDVSSWVKSGVFGGFMMVVLVVSSGERVIWLRDMRVTSWFPARFHRNWEEGRWWRSKDAGVAMFLGSVNEFLREILRWRKEVMLLMVYRQMGEEENLKVTKIIKGN